MLGQVSLGLLGAVTEGDICVPELREPLWEIPQY